MASENVGNNKRRYLHAVRPSARSRLKRDFSNTNTDINVSRGVKRKNSDVGCSESDKRPKNNIGDSVEVISKFETPNKNSANQRLQNLRRSLADGQKINNLRSSSDSRRTPQSNSSSINLGTRNQQKNTFQDHRSAHNLGNTSKSPRTQDSRFSQNRPVSNNLDTRTDGSSDKQNRSFQNNSPRTNLAIKTDFSRTQQRRSIQDRLKIKRDLPVVSKSILNKSLPVFKSSPKNVVSCNDISKYTTSTLTVASPTKSCDTIKQKVVPEISEKSKLITSKNVESNPNASIIEDEVEIMDWEPTDKETVVENINQVRKEPSIKPSIDTQPLNVPAVAEESHVQNNYPVNEAVHIVVDTNIFISHLDFISKLKNMTLKDGRLIRIVIPWMVLQELDYMKSDRSVNSSLGHSSSKAIRFINSCLSNKDPTVRGQTIMEASSHTIQSSNNPDDGILFCCIQFKALHKYVVLLSNDVNLRNKALFSDIPAYPRDKILIDLVNKAPSNSNIPEPQYDKNIKNLTSIMSNCVNEIIKSEMKEAYGENLWLKMAKKPPPYNLDDGLGLVTKFWVPVFSLKLLKQCKHCVDEFKQFIKENHIGSSAPKSSNEVHSKLVEKCLRLCIYLKNGCQEQRILIHNTLEAIKKNASVL